MTEKNKSKLAPEVEPMHSRTFDFRAIVASYSHPRKDVPKTAVDNVSVGPDPIDFWDRKTWEKTLSRWSQEGFNAVVWYGANEFGAACTGEHVICRHEEFPEAREMSSDENEKIISQMKWLMATAKRLGMKNFLYTHSVWVTPAFARAHDIYKPMQVSETVSRFHSDQPYGREIHMECGVRNEWTRKYTEAIFAELPRIYEDIDGFYGHPGGEACPGERTSWFREAIAPGLRRCGRKPLMVALQWQCTLEGFQKNVVPKEIYDNTWLGWHAYNSEQITDARPYPALVDWMETLNLPTVSSIYPANVSQVPFNSPRFAWEIMHEMKKHANFSGFLYFPWWCPPRISELFRHAIAYYAAHDKPYSDKLWLSVLEKEFGDREAAGHFLNAYNISGRILPELCALVYRGDDYAKRELRLPYEYLRYSRWLTSPARGRHIVPLGVYAQYVAQDPVRWKNRNGSEYWLPPHYYQETIWDSEGGSAYDVLPPVHMARIRTMGEECLSEAEEGLKKTANKAAAEKVYNWMKAYQLLSRYYELKVNTAVAALVHMHAGRGEDKEEALEMADKTLTAYIEANSFISEKCNPVFMELSGKSMQERGKGLDELLQIERSERESLPQIFHWPGHAPDPVL